MNIGAAKALAHADDAERAAAACGNDTAYAWAKLEARLGADRATGAAEEGRRMPLPQLVDEALAQLDSLGA